MTWKRRGGRKVIIAPDGGDAWAPAKPRPDETLIRALARAHRWKRLLEEGTYRSAAEIAEAEGVTRSFVNRLLRLTLLAPDIVEAILDGAAAEGDAAGEFHADDPDGVGGTTRDRHLSEHEFSSHRLPLARERGRVSTGNLREATPANSPSALANFFRIEVRSVPRARTPARHRPDADCQVRRSCGSI